MNTRITVKNIHVIFIIIGRVCVPIIPEECENFNPITVPTISSLYNEINDYDRKHVKNGNYKRNVEKSIIYIMK